MRNARSKQRRVRREVDKKKLEDEKKKEVNEKDIPLINEEP